ncbi:hypothetical protein GCM10022217_25370 [Chryseobacterium ginsenosidimutans]|uniref:hypothetical protein n=1 Tax=Chryseobacterium ginsenosidimutans TaxID=687846 RepID=UPI0031D60CAA
MDGEAKTLVDDEGNVIIEKEPVENVVTWIYDNSDRDVLTPIAKLINDRKYSVISYKRSALQEFIISNRAIPKAINICLFFQSLNCSKS